MSDYRVLRGPLHTRPQVALAPRFTQVEDALRAMGDGIVVNGPDARLVAFHERHLPTIERLAAS